MRRMNRNALRSRRKESKATVTRSIQKKPEDRFEDDYDGIVVEIDRKCPVRLPVVSRRGRVGTVGLGLFLLVPRTRSDAE